MAKKRELDIIKAGTKITYYACCTYTQKEEVVTEVLEFDTTVDTLNSIAHDYAMDTIQPEGWFEIEEEK